MNKLFRQAPVRRPPTKIEGRPLPCVLDGGTTTLRSTEGDVVPADSADRQRFWERLYRGYRHELCGRLRSRFGDGPPDPEDIAQQAFIKFYEADYPDAHVNPKGLIYRIASNLIIDFHRSKSRWEDMIDEIYSDLNLTPIETLDAESALFETELLDIIASAVNDLPDKQRAMLIESRVHGQSYKQMSQANGWSLGDISRNMTAAMEKVHAAVSAWRDGGSAPGAGQPSR